MREKNQHIHKAKRQGGKNNYSKENRDKQIHPQKTLMAQSSAK